MKFEVGETVVYPHHGAAEIIEVSEKTIRGETQTYLKLKVAQGDLTIEVPAEACSLVTADGTVREVDVVVCATGYAAADYLGQLDVSGEHGATLREELGDLAALALRQFDERGHVRQFFHARERELNRDHHLALTQRRDLAFEPFDVGDDLQRRPMLHVVVDKFLVAVQR